MSTQPYLLIKSTGDGRALLQSEHLRVNALVSGTVGDQLVVSTSTTLGQRAGSLEIVFVASTLGGTGAWTNMPAALTELYGDAFQRRTKDLRGFTQFRLAINVETAGAAGAVLGAQYSLDAGANWAGLDNGTAATISDLTQAINATGAFVTAWATLNTAAAINGILLRIVGSGGDGAADPSFRLIIMEVR